MYYDNIDDSEGINVNNTAVSKSYIICHYLYYWDEGFKFQPI